MVEITSGESGASVRAKLNALLDSAALYAIDAAIAGTAVDVFVYDTSHADVDGV